MKSNRKFSILRKEMESSVWSSIEALVVRFYGPDVATSKVTSSHWKKYGESQNADLDEFVLNIEGSGFGDYENCNNLTSRDRVKNLFPTLATKIAICTFPKPCRVAVYSLAKKTDRLVNQDFIRLAKSAYRISQHIEEYNLKRVMIIGDGWGTLGCLLKELHPRLILVQVNLGRSLLFDLAFSAKALSNNRHNLIANLNEIFPQDFSYIPAENVTVMNADIDLFVAIESFQEMDIEIVNEYFKLIRKQEVVTFLYSANRDSKTLPDGSIIRKKSYGWNSHDNVVFERTPWWLNWGIRRRPPFIFRMDGRIDETLVQISNRA